MAREISLKVWEGTSPTVRHGAIHFIGLDDGLSPVPESGYEDMTVRQLRDAAKMKGLRGHSRRRKADLLKALQNSRLPSGLDVLVREVGPEPGIVLASDEPRKDEP